MAPPIAQVKSILGQKRKASSNNGPGDKRGSKRTRVQDARKILTQAPDPAISKNGDLDVSSFLKARQFEIRAMLKNMQDSKHVLRTRAFQQVPRNMRRRTASHNVKKIPKRLRARAEKEIREDNMPTAKTGKKRLTRHQRLRLEKAKELKKKGALKNKKKQGSRPAADQTAGEKSDVLVSAPTKNKLARHERPQPRFRKRQVHKSWLPTHIWHSKRAHMSEPMDPLWRYAIPLTPTEKCFRTTHRASAMRGCVAWDTSYMPTIGLEGVERSLNGILTSTGLDIPPATTGMGVKWRRGTRSWSGWMRERDGRRSWVAPVTTAWCPVEAMARANDQTEEAMNRVNRKMFLRVHPSAFFQAWNELLRVAKIMRPQVVVHDLRLEIGSLELIGPESTEALIAALQPIEARKEAPVDQSAELASMDDAGDSKDSNEWEDLETPSKLWQKLVTLTNPASLPKNALLAFNVSDPRLRHPAHTIKRPADLTDQQLVATLNEWPVDETQTSADIFDPLKRRSACQHLASQKSINRRKGAAPPGEYPTPLSKDPHIPILAMASRPPSGQPTGQGSWTILLPWDCVLPMWYTLVHYPLSSGGNPRFGCLQEKMQTTFEQGGLWFPGDFPGTSAGWDWELKQRERSKREWERKPKGRRPQWDSVILGEGRKGEIGLGWACDWERLVNGATATASGDMEQKREHQSAATKKPLEEAKGNAKDAERTGDDPAPLPKPPADLHFLPSPMSPPRSGAAPTISTTALSPIRLRFLDKGHAHRCARIYRLPSTDSKLKVAWLDVPTTSASANKLAKSKKPSQKPRPAHPLSAQEKAAALAASLLQPPDGRGDRNKDLPAIPDEADLIGFVTSSNYNLGHGQCEAVGSILAARVQQSNGDHETTDTTTTSPMPAKNAGAQKIAKEKRRLCIVRNAGESVGRLAQWSFA